jgi:anthranilate phosphoribosyltransferase
VFRGDDGLDELTTTGHSHIWEVSRGSVTEHDLDPLELGIPRTDMSTLVGGDGAHNASVARAVLAGQLGPVRDIVLLNAAAGLVAFDLAGDPSQLLVPIVERFRVKIAVAAQTIDSGAAIAKLDAWVSATARV